jgi:hypothetical protein
MMILESSSDLINSIYLLVREWFTLNPTEPLKTAVKVATIAGTVVTVVTTLSTKTGPWLAAKLKTRSISRHLGPEFTIAGIHRSVRYYIRALCQDLDPAGAEEPRLVYGVQEKLFDALDKALTHPTEHNFIFLLADSGMGKTSALINYYARHLRRFRKPFKLFLIPLGIPDADERIAKITDRAGSVLFLDALDEDTLAMVDHAERLRTLLSLTRDFERVLISCRTQFFSKDEEIPKETGKIKVGARAAGESAEYYFHKIYLSPFNDDQVTKYLKRRYPIWRYGRRRKAHAIVKKIPNLTVRPMLLAHVDDIVQSNRDIKYSYQLYEEMVEAWLEREQGFIKKTDDLRQFSELLAVDLYLNRRSRGSERIERAQLVTLAQEWGILLEDWSLSGRSLLNRDADGNYKFAHRSIMEYLFVSRFLEGEGKCLDEEWTDQMIDFYMEILYGNEEDCFRCARPILSTFTEAAFTSRGRRLFDVILRESMSNDFNRYYTAKMLLGRLCFEMLNPEHNSDMYMSIGLIDKLETPEVGIRSSVESVSSTEGLFKIQVYIRAGDDVPRVIFNDTEFEERHFPSIVAVEDSELPIWDDFPRMMIELNGHVIGNLNFDFDPLTERHMMTKSRWDALEKILNPNKSSHRVLRFSFTEEAKTVLREASIIALLEGAASVQPNHLICALMVVDQLMFENLFSLRSFQLERLHQSLSGVSFGVHPRGRILQNQLRKLWDQISDNLRLVLRAADSERIADKKASIAWKHLLLAVLDSNEEMLSELGAVGVDYAKAEAFFKDRNF